MALSSPGFPVQQSRAAEGVFCVLIGMALFVGQDGLMKELLGAFSLWPLIAIRALVTVLILVPVIVLLGHPHRLITPFWPLHLLRASLFVFGFSLFYAAFPLMGLAEVTTIFFSAPLFTALLAAVLLGESVGPHRIAALGVGFAGVLIAINPVAGDFTWISILPLFCAVSYAFSQIIARQIGERETTLTMGLYTIGFAGALALPVGWGMDRLVGLGSDFQHLRWDWNIDLATEGWSLLMLGLIGMGGYMLLSRAYQVANASLIAPFDYVYLPMAAVMAYVVWGEVPGETTMAGMVLIITSGLYLGYREVVSHRRSVAPPPVAEAVFVPGNPMPATPPREDVVS